MEDLFKKLLYAGVGLASQTGDKFEKALEDLAKKGQKSDSDVKEAADELVSRVDDLIEKAGTTREDFEARFKEVVDKVPFGKKGSELDELKARVEELEGQLAKAKTTTKKTTAKA